MRKSFKYRLYPNKTTEKKLTGVLDRCRELYNACLQEHRDAYTIKVKQHPNYSDKAEDAGRQVLQVPPKYTSQVCSGCGTVRKKALDQRWHSCECGTELDRDHNAAINIQRLGRSQQAAHLRASGGSPVEVPGF